MEEEREFALVRSPVLVGDQSEHVWKERVFDKSEERFYYTCHV